MNFFEQELRKIIGQSTAAADFPMWDGPVLSGSTLTCGQS